MWFAVFAVALVISLLAGMFWPVVRENRRLAAMSEAERLEEDERVRIDSRVW